MITESEAVQLAEKHWNITFKHVGGGEYKSNNGCPFCGDGGKGDRSDRFRLFTSGDPRCWCRKCGYQVFINNLYRNQLTPLERKQLAHDAELKRLKRKQTELEQRVYKLEKLNQLKPHILYYNALTPEAVEYWCTEGIDLPAINDFLLGYCESCPTDYEHRPSYTIPVMNNGTLLNVRHRIINATDGDKYRPQMAGLGNQLFNTDALLKNKNRVVIWEGEKKTIVLSQYIRDAANIGIMGKMSWEKDWSSKLMGFQDVVIALDPDAEERAHNLGKILRNTGVKNIRVANFPLKPDDAIVLYGATGRDIQNYIEYARPI
jgi:hypothetical protein